MIRLRPQPPVSDRRISSKANGQITNIWISGYRNSNGHLLPISTAAHLLKVLLPKGSVMYSTGASKLQPSCRHNLRKIPWVPWRVREVPENGKSWKHTKGLSWWNEFKNEHWPSRSDISPWSLTIWIGFVLKTRWQKMFLDLCYTLVPLHLSAKVVNHLVGIPLPAKNSHGHPQ